VTHEVREEKEMNQLTQEGPVRISDSNEPKIWRYYFPNEGYEGWAEVILTSGGYFSAVSDYGNYAYAWRCHGEKDFRMFFLNIETDYVASKLCPRAVYDGEATKKCIREYILDMRKQGLMEKDEAREEWESCSDVDESDFVFGCWCTRTEISDAWEMSRYRADPQVVAFVEKIVQAKLAPALRAQLREEGLL